MINTLKVKENFFIQTDVVTVIIQHHCHSHVSMACVDEPLNSQTYTEKCGIQAGEFSYFEREVIIINDKAAFLFSLLV